MEPSSSHFVQPLPQHAKKGELLVVKESAADRHFATVTRARGERERREAAESVDCMGLRLIPAMPSSSTCAMRAIRGVNGVLGRIAAIDRAT